MVWAIVWPLLLATWAFLFFWFFICIFFRRGNVEPGDALDRIRSSPGPVERSLRWVSYLSAAVGGLILFVWLPTWFAWGHLYFRGVPVRAKVVSTKEEYDPERIGGHFVTRVTYEFEAEVSGERHQFLREGELPGRYQMVSGFINVLHDPADPARSRMTREFRELREGLVTAAVFLAIGVGFFLLTRRRGRTQSTRSGSAVA